MWIPRLWLERTNFAAQLDLRHTSEPPQCSQKTENNLKIKGTEFAARSHDPPSYRRVRELSHCVNASNSIFWNVTGIPIPVSRTAIVIRYSGRSPLSSKPALGAAPPRGERGVSKPSFDSCRRMRFAVTETSTSPPSSVNLAELLRRLVRIWRRRTSSAQIQLQKEGVEMCERKRGGVKACAVPGGETMSVNGGVRLVFITGWLRIRVRKRGKWHSSQSSQRNSRRPSKKRPREGLFVL